MLFYRGIAVAADMVFAVTEKIRGRGLVPEDGSRRMNFNDLKLQLSELWQRPSISTADTKFEGVKPSWVCACADKGSAVYYATEHNFSKSNDAPILISFEADLRDVIIDGRDFLYTLFQFGDPQRARPIAEHIYGKPILQYLDRAWSSDSQDQRIVMCDLATQDDSVIKAHAKNKAVIGGRYRTRFRTAFMVQGPVPAERIISVGPPESTGTTPDAEITLDMIRSS